VVLGSLLIVGLLAPGVAPAGPVSTAAASRVVAGAEAPAPLPVGTRVRVELRWDEANGVAPARRREIGAIAAWSADSLVIARGGQGASSVPLVAIRRLDVSRGPSAWGGAGRGAGFGFLGGVVVALVAIPILDRGGDPAPAVLILVGATPLLGASVGALVGRSFPTERWERRR